METTDAAAANAANTPVPSSQTASDYIASQLRLEADAREALPYQFDTCTKPLGPLRQSVFACLTCTPPPASPHQQFTPAGVCYSCSISCHGEHNLVELFTKRDFECDCGTTRMSNGGTACSLRIHAGTGRKGGVVGEVAREGNGYNQNYEGRFCGCGEEYDPETEKGTMFQCLGLGVVGEGGCGEDWWHPECLMGLPRVKDEVKKDGEEEQKPEKTTSEADGVRNGDVAPEEAPPDLHFEEPPLPPGFPAEDDFDHLICYKCTNAFPWIKAYAGTPGFLPAVSAEAAEAQPNDHTSTRTLPSPPPQNGSSTKRKAEEDVEPPQNLKRSKSEPDAAIPQDVPQPSEPTEFTAPSGPTPTHHTTLPHAPTTPTSLFLHSDFRSHLCRCATCFPRLALHKQLLEEEESYEPPVSDSDAGENDGASTTNGSLLERGEAALSNMDRVRAIEGAMAYNKVRDKVKAFLAPFAESGKAVGAEDVKEYFARLRGDEEGMAVSGEVGEKVEGDGRREQGGY